jgi:hypothetical protein
MSVKSVPFCWLECDKCGAKSTEGSDYAAWADVGGAEDDARDSGWTVTSDGRHYCTEHWANVCQECEAYDEGEGLPEAIRLSGERDYQCRTCHEGERSEGGQP